MIRAVLFDVDDTLCDDRGQMIRCIARTSEEAARLAGGIDASALARAYQAISDRFWHFEFSLDAPPPLDVVRRRLWRDALTASGTAPTDEVIEPVIALYDALRREPVTAFPGTLETLAALHGRGLILAALTNGFSETHVPKLERLGAGPYFSEIFTPDRLGVAKPDPRAFHLACAALGVAPGETVHVGDSPSADIGGAKGAGLRAVWFNPDGLTLPDGTPAPDREISAISELLTYLS